MTKKKSVAILGFAPTWKDAPFDDPSVQIWTVNSLNQYTSRVDRVFELHQLDTIKRMAKEGIVRNDTHLKDHVEWLQKNKDIPVYMICEYPDVPMAVTYPIEEIVLKFGLPRAGDGEVDPYFTNSISYMIALAIHEGFERIYIYGVDMACHTEYGSQRPSCEYYIGIAKGMGIEVIMPAESDLLKSKYMYGYEEERLSSYKKKVNQFIDATKTRRQEAKEEMDRVTQVYWQYDGAIAAIEEMSRLWE